MTLSISFYDGVKYHGPDFNNRDKDFYGNGVMNPATSQFPLTYPSTPNMTFNVGAGVAYVDGYRIANDSNVVTLTVSAADATNPRIDIVQLGHDDVNSTFSLVVKKGVAAASPIEPGADTNYIKLYAINVAANATSITSANVTDRRTVLPLNVSGSQISLAGAAGNGANTFTGTQTAPEFVATSTTAPLQLPSLSAVPATIPPSGTVCIVNGQWYESNGTAWNPMSATLPSDLAKTDVAQTWTATQTFSSVPSFSYNSGAPFSVTNNTQVNNLNAQYVGGLGVTSLGRYGTAGTWSTTQTFSAPPSFTQAAGTAPFSVTSNTKVTNLNADLLDGIDSSSFGQLGVANTWTQTQTFSGGISTNVFTPSGLTGATSTSRYVGGTASGAPSTGTFNIGDFVVDQTGAIWICTTAGSPGTWTRSYVLPSDVAKTDVANTWTQSQTFNKSLTISNGGANGVAGHAPYIFMQNYSTQSGGQATFLSNWAGNHYWGIGGVDSANVKVGVVNDTTGTWATDGTPFTFNVGGNLTANAFAPNGLTGATAATRYVGGTTSGAPTSGTFVVGDWVRDQAGQTWTCTVAGSPGTWVKGGAGHFQSRVVLSRFDFNTTSTTNSNAAGAASGQMAFVFHASEWNGSSFVAEFSVFTSSTNTCYAGIWDITSSAVVSGSEVSYSGSTQQIVRSPAITLVDGHSYTLYIRSSNSSTASVTGCDLIYLN